ncbi:MAG: zinc metallopeptidase [Candidatus Eremiobacteraeota bacterium]|nr:zinc metallopeptidase [Candidatus Eremiobacteraeota bacterium]
MIGIELINPFLKGLRRLIFPLSRYIPGEFHELSGTTALEFLEEIIRSRNIEASICTVESGAIAHPYFDPLKRMFFMSEEFAESTEVLALVETAHVASHIIQYEKEIKPLKLMERLHGTLSKAQAWSDRLFWPVLITMGVFLLEIFFKIVPESLSMIGLLTLIVLLVFAIPFILIFLFQRVLEVLWNTLCFFVEHGANRDALEFLERRGEGNPAFASSLKKAKVFLSHYASHRLDEEPCVRFSRKEDEPALVEAGKVEAGE